MVLSICIEQVAYFVNKSFEPETKVKTCNKTIALAGRLYVFLMELHELFVCIADQFVVGIFANIFPILRFAFVFPLGFPLLCKSY